MCGSVDNADKKSKWITCSSWNNLLAHGKIVCSALDYLKEQKDIVVNENGLMIIDSLIIILLSIHVLMSFFWYCVVP